ncbi:hypothetical protein Nm8I071_03140 [Nonomuraea sp. TT08I-71]|nr:hypothetical protein Nm8I071_03140 [Nonomuraea sp. TT08I-71]
MRRRADGLTARIGTLRPSWSGTASATARGRIGELRTDLTDLLPALIEVDQVLAEFAPGWAPPRPGSAPPWHGPTRAACWWTGPGRSGPIRPTPDRPLVGPAVAQAGAEIHGALALAGTRTMRRPAGGGTAAATGWGASRRPGDPHPGRSAEVSRWWRPHPAERRWLVGTSRTVGRSTGAGVGRARPTG